jgi:mono/diheme cytochrome c family protein
MIPYLTAERDELRSKKTVIEGGDLYSQNCTSCHGTKGRGDGVEAERLEFVPTNLVQGIGEKSDNVILARIALGKGKSMSPFQKLLSELEMWSIIDCVHDQK